MGKVLGADVIVASTPAPPMTYYESAVETIYRGAEADLPILFANGAVMGGTGPATIAGSSLTGNAEIIGGIVLAQLLKPGVRVLATNFIFPQNMRSGIPCFGAIEAALSTAVFCQYFRRFGIPVMVANTGPVSSKIIDFQCGQEKTMNSILAAVCGANLIFFIGGIFGELTFHPAEAILDNDIAGMIGRFIEGVTINDETMAVDVIDKVGPIPGHFLGEEHTRKWWKLEQFAPKVADRLTYPEWVNMGKKSCLDYAREIMEEILATHKPQPLTPKQEEDVERILEEARQYYQKKDLISDEEMTAYRKSMKSPNYPYE